MYDAAFKYLMDDQPAARLLVEAVLGEEIVSLEALPQERSGRPSPAGDPSSAEMLTKQRLACRWSQSVQTVRIVDLLLYATAERRIAPFATQ